LGIRTLARAGQVVGLVVVTATTTVLAAAPASAEPPTNDTIAAATVVSAFPFSETVDTSEATTDAEDAAINVTCGAPVTNGSVWYTFEAGSSPAYVVDVSDAPFDAGVIVATGSPGSLELVTCGPFSVGFEATPGQTYYVMAFSFDPEVVGGQLPISITEAEPAPKISMTVDDVGRVNRETGVATISGTYTCVGQADFVDMFGTLQQEQADGVQVRGGFEAIDLPCGGTFDWSFDVTAESGGFQRGLAATIATTIGCNALGCNFFDALEVVRLRGGGH
jgi:hypothetical protein